MVKMGVSVGKDHSEAPRPFDARNPFRKIWHHGAEGIVELDDSNQEDRRATFSGWIANLFVWDGVLPMLVVAIPELLRVLFPNPLANKGVMTPVELVSLLVPITFFIVRIARGSTLFPLIYSWQRVCFFLALFPLALAECVIVLIGGNRQAFPDAEAGALVLFAVYICLMAIATLPIRKQRDGGAHQQ